jgi:hypothetical protein
MQQGGEVGFQAEPLPYAQFERPIGLEHPFGYSMHFPTLGGGYSRPLRYEEGGTVMSPYQPRSKVIRGPGRYRLRLDRREDV